jgi:hypothetical protein
MYVFSEKFLDDLAARVTGPMSFRFIVQPLVAVFLGFRDGRMDAKAGTPPFIFDILFRPADRKRQLGSAFHRLLTPIIVATVLDAIAQYLIFKHVRPLPALLVGTFLMGLPYSLARGLTNRVVTALHRKSGEKDDA